MPGAGGNVDPNDPNAVQMVRGSFSEAEQDALAMALGPFFSPPLLVAQCADVGNVHSKKR